MAWVVGETSVGPPSGVDPVGTMRLRISNNNNNNKGRTSYFLNNGIYYHVIHHIEAKTKRNALAS